MMSRPVAVLDSGIGGLPYLSWLQDHLPGEPLLYVADAAQFPYGEKSADQVRTAVTEVAASLMGRWNPKLLLVACNTASVVALDALRALLDIPVVGVVPAVKKAAGVGTGLLAVLATARTVENGYWEDLVRTFAPERPSRGYAAPDLVSLIEEGVTGPAREAALAAWAERLHRDGAGTVVLGCTHFLHLTRDLERHLGPEVAVVDSLEGVGRQVARVLEDRALLAEGGTRSPDEFRFTVRPDWGDGVLLPLEARYRTWAQGFRLTYGGPWVPSRVPR